MVELRTNWAVTEPSSLNFSHRKKKHLLLKCCAGRACFVWRQVLSAQRRRCPQRRARPLQLRVAGSPSRSCARVQRSPSVSELTPCPNNGYRSCAQCASRQCCCAARRAAPGTRNALTRLHLHHQGQLWRLQRGWCHLLDHGHGKRARPGATRGCVKRGFVVAFSRVSRRTASLDVFCQWHPPGVCGHLVCDVARLCCGLVPAMADASSHRHQGARACLRGLSCFFPCSWSPE